MKNVKLVPIEGSDEGESPPAVVIRDGLLQVDSGSTETFLNGVRCEDGKAYPLNEADVLVLGQQPFRVLMESDEERMQTVGYEVLSKIGQGGTGTVYRARSMANGDIVALKVLRDGLADPILRRRFMREIEIAAGLSHPNIVQVLSVQLEEPCVYLAMSLCEGGSLQALLDGLAAPLAVDQATAWICEALQGLHYTHSRGYVHRDIKPANILLSDGVARLADFGLAKSWEQAGQSGLTRSTERAGTWAFMPPEQLVNFRDVGPATDVYSMSATLYRLLTMAFVRDFPRGPRDPTPILNSPVIPIRQRVATIPKPLAEVIDRALSEDVKARYPSAADFSTALEQAMAEGG